MATEIIAESTELGIIVGYSALRGEYWMIRGKCSLENIAKTAVVLCRATPSEEDGRRIPSVAELISTKQCDEAGDTFIIEVVYKHNAPPV